MVKVTMIARMTDGLPLAEGLEHFREHNDFEFYKQKAKLLFKKISQGEHGPSRMSIRIEPYCFHYIIEDGVCYITLCDQSYPRKLAFHYLEDLQREFGKLNRSQIETASKPYAFIKFGLKLKRRESKDPIIKASMKAEAARALWKLAKNNIKTCKSITESKALLCFAILLEKGKGEVQFHSAMAVMEIAAVAEENADLRRSAFKTNSPAAKSLVDQLLRIVEEGDSDLLIPCIKAIGCLSRTFPARETRLIAPLVKHLDHRELSVSREASIALGKFACIDNYLHMEHSRAIIESSGVPYLIQLVYFGDGIAQIPALILLCYLALHVGDSEALAKAEALSALEWASKQVILMQDPTVEKLLPEAKSRLELYQSRGYRFH